MIPPCQTYGAASTDAAQPAKPSMRVHSVRAGPARRRVKMLAGMLCVVSLMAFVVLRLNPESARVRSDSLARFEVLRGTFLALARVWSRGEGGAKGAQWSVPMGNVLMGAECCNENLCSKYALQACKSKRRARRAADAQSSQIAAEVDDLRASTSSGWPAPGQPSSGVGRQGSASGGDDTSADGAHPGATRAAAALGLTLMNGQGGAGGPLRSYFGEQREAREQAAAAQAASDAPMPTVGLISSHRSAHLGAQEALIEIRLRFDTFLRMRIRKSSG